MSDTAEHSPRALYWISGMFFFAFLGPGALQLFLSDFYQGAGYDGETSRALRSWVLLALYGSFLVWRVFISFVVRAMGARWSITAGVATYCLFAVTLTITPLWQAHVAAAVLMGWGAACIWIGGTAYILHVTPPDRYGYAVGFRRLALMASYTIGYPLLGWCLTKDPSANVAGWLAVGAGVMAVAVSLFVPHRHVPVAPFRLSRFVRVAARREILLVGFFLLGSALSYGLVLSFFRDFVGQEVLSPFHVGLVLAPFALAQGICSLVGGTAMDWFGKGRVLQIGFAGSAIGLALMLTGAIGQSVLLLAVPAALLGVQVSLVDTGADALVGDVVRDEHRTLANGAMFIWRDLGMLVPMTAHLLLGGFIEREHYRIVFGVVAGYFFLCMLLAGRASGWLDRRRQQV